MELAGGGGGPGEGVTTHPSDTTISVFLNWLQTCFMTLKGREREKRRNTGSNQNEEISTNKKQVTKSPSRTRSQSRPQNLLFHSPPVPRISTLFRAWFLLFVLWTVFSANPVKSSKKCVEGSLTPVYGTPFQWTPPWRTVCVTILVRIVLPI